MESATPIPDPPGFDDLSKEEQIRYLQALWDRIAEHPDEIPVPESHIALAEERLAEYRRDPGRAKPAYDVLDRLALLLGLPQTSAMRKDMDLEETSREIMKLSVAERIKLVEAIWDSIATEQESLELTEAQRLELDRRLEAYAASPEEGSSWEEAKSRILAEKG